MPIDMHTNARTHSRRTRVSFQDEINQERKRQKGPTRRECRQTTESPFKENWHCQREKGFTLSSSTTFALVCPNRRRSVCVYVSWENVRVWKNENKWLIGVNVRELLPICDFDEGTHDCTLAVYAVVYARYIRHYFCGLFLPLRLSMYVVSV